VMSFINFTKYPPSLDYLLFTLGIAALLAAWLEALENRFTRCCATLGGAPMFYYLLHLYVLLIAQKLALACFGANYAGRRVLEQVWQVWGLALVLLVLLYPLCARFARYKRTSQQAWLRYL